MITIPCIWPNGPISPELAERLQEILKPWRLRKNEFLLKAGEESDKFFIVQEGFLWAYKKPYRIIATGFFEPGQVYAHAGSFFRQLPNTENVQALEDTLVAYITFKQYQQLNEQYPEFAALCRQWLEDGLVAWEQRQQACWMQTPGDRYKWLLQTRPQLLQKALLKSVASYLGMSTKTICRVRRGYKW